MAQDQAESKSLQNRERFYYTNDKIAVQKFNWSQLSRLLIYLKPYSKKILPGAIITLIIGTAIRLFVPILIGMVAFDRIIKHGKESDLFKLVAAIGVLYLISYVCSYFQIKLTNKLGQFMIYDLRKQLFNHVQYLSNRFFDSRSAGSILVRIINDVNSLQDLFTNGVINTLTDFIMLIGIIVILFSLSWQLAIAVMVIIPIMFFISTKFRQKIRRSWQYVRVKMSKLNSHLNESLQGIRVTQAYNQEVNNRAFFEKVNTDARESWKEATKQNAVFGPFVQLANAVGSAILIWWGSYLILHGHITTGVFVSFAFYLGMFWDPISRIGNTYNQLLVAMASSERIFEFLDETPNVKDVDDPISMDTIKGRINFENVEFAYDSKRKALNGINLEFPAGSTIALVGHTGSGKSTIANLVGRFYDPTKGAVKFDGIDVRNIKLSELRKEVSTVIQETFIFSGTIMENIRFGRPDATDEEVIAASKAVGADPFIQRLKDGYQTEVEERGNVLSVGERQLLSFARSLLANPKILILDEATSSIDTESELIIQDALNTLLKGRTSIIIAHRLSTIRDADKIVVLEHGNILEEGNHDQLMEKKGKYYELILSQFEALNAG
ncbi:ABC transporter ATP-binding protein [Pullulanibacillus sp. KACC 23026]|uniref:ABC transporter ATP-binding protein n=1 Tax=Pullulanibacillus sp. KACC 23026 TaxID=3028315 RepID=UPI0023AF438D|nr:ABC transporter ATP-binding protein [Pullulanibacillus sp. KACC 23026]WEG11767.1 ABC transporter ATP-binding protein [Pullulanibacillus sp. KACC 23026]